MYLVFKKNATRLQKKENQINSFVKMGIISRITIGIYILKLGIIHYKVHAHTNSIYNTRLTAGLDI